MMEEEERSECHGWNCVPPPSITSVLFPRKEERVGTIYDRVSGGMNELNGF